MRTKFVTNNQTLTITATSGKRGWNVKASWKVGQGKGSQKAQTGARSLHSNETDAANAYDVLVEEAVRAGWTPASRAPRNAFTEIPSPFSTDAEAALNTVPPPAPKTAQRRRR